MPNEIPEGLKPRQFHPCGSSCAGGKEHEPHWWNGARWWCPGWPFPLPELYGLEGCATYCQKKVLAGEGHTLRWGECSKAEPPQPRVSMSRVYTDYDGYPSIGFDNYTEEQLAELIEPALRSVSPGLGATHMYAPLARAAAHAIIHRNDRKTDG